MEIRSKPFLHTTTHFWEWDSMSKLCQKPRRHSWKKPCPYWLTSPSTQNPASFQLHRISTVRRLMSQEVSATPVIFSLLDWCNSLPTSFHPVIKLFSESKTAVWLVVLKKKKSDHICYSLVIGWVFMLKQLLKKPNTNSALTIVIFFVPIFNP